MIISFPFTELVKLQLRGPFKGPVGICKCKQLQEV